jgi:N-acetyl-gamma-glutamyl-phosphate reductase
VDTIELYVFGAADGSQARLAAVLDNLGKGASGAAVQNLNLMAGLDETAGLRL